MSLWLKQSTVVNVPIGRFVDSTDGNTEETALTINNTDIKLFKEGAVNVVSKNSGGATHMANGLYYMTLDTTDTSTLGKLEVHVHVSGALPVMRQFHVLPANVYDSLVSGSDWLQVDTQAINDVAITGNGAGTPFGV